eukprot:SAG11_NODE_649_length_7940_cov_12.287973_4_plen_91_part_00
MDFTTDYACYEFGARRARAANIRILAHRDFTTGVKNRLRSKLDLYKRPVKLAIKYERVESVKLRSLTEIVRDTVRVRVVAAPHGSGEEIV